MTLMSMPWCWAHHQNCLYTAPLRPPKCFRTATERQRTAGPGLKFHKAKSDPLNIPLKRQRTMTEVNKFQLALQQTHIPMMEKTHAQCLDEFAEQVTINALINHGLLRYQAERLAKKYQGTARQRYDAIKRRGWLTDTL